MSDLILPTDEQVERAARAICASLGQNPDRNFAGWEGGERWRLQEFTAPAKQILAVLLNQCSPVPAPVSESFIAQQLERDGSRDPLLSFKERSAPRLDEVNFANIEKLSSKQPLDMTLDAALQRTCNGSDSYAGFTHNYEQAETYRKWAMQQPTPSIPEPAPIALTDDHVASLERAIRAEGFDIRVDTETGEAKLYRVTGDGSTV